MTRDEITRMAREAGFVGMDARHGALSRFAVLVAAAEREHLHKSAEAYKSVLEAAPQPPALTDERIMELMGFRVKGGVFGELKAKHAIKLARAIEREILGGGE